MTHLNTHHDIATNTARVIPTKDVDLVGLQQIDALYSEIETLIPSDLDRASVLCAQAADWLRTIHYPTGQGLYHIYVGAIAFYRGQYEATLKHMESGLHLLPADHKKRVIALNTLGATCRRVSDFPTAINYYEQVYETALAQQSAIYQAAALSGISSIYMTMEQYDRMRDYLQQALAIASPQDNPRQVAQFQGNICYAYLRLGDYTNAIVHGEQSVQTLIAERYQAAGTFSFTSLALAYHATGQSERALELLHHALNTVRQHRLQAENEVLRHIGTIHLDWGELDEAGHFLHASLMVTQTGESIASSYALLARLAKARGDFASALTYLEQHNKLMEHQQIRETQERLQQLELQSRVRQARAEADRYRLHAEQVELQRQQDREYFERLAQIRSEFIDAATHDLKNPLARIFLNLDMLERGHLAPEERGQRYLINIRQASGVMKMLISEILELVKLETGRVIEARAQPINTVLRECALDLMPLADSKSITLEICPPQPPLELVYDFRLLYRALENLLVNAIKYSPPGSRVWVTVEKRTDEVIIGVHDNGPGIAADDLPNIFKRFYRGRGTQMDAEDGSGLGLSIVQAIVENHNGHVWIESTLAEGTHVCFSLPL